MLTSEPRTQSLVALESSKPLLNLCSQTEGMFVGKDYQQQALFQTNAHCYPRAVVGYVVAVSSYSHPETTKLMSRPKTRREILGSSEQESAMLEMAERV